MRICVLCEKLTLGPAVRAQCSSARMAAQLLIPDASMGLVQYLRRCPEQVSCEDRCFSVTLEVPQAGSNACDACPNVLLSGKRGPAETGILRRIHFTYERATRKFKADLDLWLSWIDFCKSSKSTKQMSKVMGEDVCMRPCMGTCAHEGVWMFVLINTWRHS